MKRDMQGVSVEQTHMTDVRSPLDSLWARGGLLNGIWSALNSEAVNSERATAQVSAAGSAIPLLVEIVRSGSTQGKAKAAAELMKLSVKVDVMAEISKEGAIPPLVELVRSGSDEGKANAAGVLRNLALNVEGKVAIAEAGAIPPLIDLVRQGSAEGKGKAAAALSILANNADNQRAIMKVVRHASL